VYSRLSAFSDWINQCVSGGACPSSIPKNGLTSLNTDNKGYPELSLKCRPPKGLGCDWNQLPTATAVGLV
jgi:hypothetical protein